MRRGGGRKGTKSSKKTSESKGKKQRWVVGIHSCLEALKVRSQWVEEVAILKGKELDESLQKVLQPFQKLTQERSRNFFEDLSEVHQGLAVKMSGRPRYESSDEGKVLAFLDGLTDPHNLGAMMRTAWLFDVGGLFLPKNRSVKLNATVSKIASGGAEHIPVEEVHFPSELSELKEQGYWVFGLSEKADQSLFDVQLPEKTVFVVGAEGKGMRSSTEGFCDGLVSIPQTSKAASLNASVAFSLAIYEYRRQNRGVVSFGAVESDSP